MKYRVFPRFVKARRCAAFTFAEVLASMLLLAILVPVIVEGLTLANRAAVVSERSTVALLLADQQLSQLQLNDAWRYGETQGNFGADWPGYRWELSKPTWGIDSMVELTLEIIFEVQGRDYRVRLSTLVDESAS